MTIQYSFYSGTGGFGFFDDSGSPQISMNDPSADQLVVTAFTGLTGLSTDADNPSDLDAFWNSALAKQDEIDTDGIEFIGEIGGYMRALGGWGDDIFRFRALTGSYILASHGDDVMETGSGEDRLAGGSGRDTMDGGAASDTLLGGRGRDRIHAGADDDIYGGGGFDRVDLTGAAIVDGEQNTWTMFVAEVGVSGAFEGVEHLVGSSGDDYLATGNDLLVIQGGEGDDTLDGGARAETLRGGAGDDIVIWGAGAGLFVGGVGIDTLRFGGADADGVVVDLDARGVQDTLAGIKTINGFENASGGAGGDSLSGNRSTNWLWGLDGADTLDGSGGADVLIGGVGDDLLTGGEGRDRFLYTSLDQSVSGDSDWITDLEASDIIDVSEIDANALVDGNQAFSRGGASLSGVAGEIAATYDGGEDVTTFVFDVDGDADSDMVINATGDWTGYDGFVF